MSIILSDVPAAVADYIEQNVTIEISDVVHSTSSVLQPDEEATFTAMATTQEALWKAQNAQNTHGDRFS